MVEKILRYQDFWFELFPEVIQFILLYLAHGGSSFSDRNLVSVPVVPIIRQFFRRSIVHWKILKFNKHVDSGFKISHLVFLQHVKAKEHVHWLSLQYRKATEKKRFQNFLLNMNLPWSEIFLFYLNLCHVYPSWSRENWEEESWNRKSWWCVCCSSHTKTFSTTNLISFEFPLL